MEAYACNQLLLPFFHLSLLSTSLEEVEILKLSFMFIIAEKLFHFSHGMIIHCERHSDVFNLYYLFRHGYSSQTPGARKHIKHFFLGRGKVSLRET